MGIGGKGTVTPLLRGKVQVPPPAGHFVSGGHWHPSNLPFEKARYTKNWKKNMFLLFSYFFFKNFKFFKYFFLKSIKALKGAKEQASI